MKTCFKCGESKPIDDFYGHPQMRDGHLNKCKECTKKDVRERREACDSVREYDRARSRLPHRRRGRNYKPDSQKIRAHNMVSRAVRAGALVRQPCEHCGSTESIEAHHEDYDKPLDVMWLCPRCHRRQDAWKYRLAALASSPLERKRAA